VKSWNIDSGGDTETAVSSTRRHDRIYFAIVPAFMELGKSVDVTIGEIIVSGPLR
jgi:hypothetical protein